MPQLDPCSSEPMLAAYRFSGYTLVLARGVLRDARRIETGLRPKTAEVLRHLAGNGRVVSREALMQAVWPEVIVTAGPPFPDHPRGRPPTFAGGNKGATMVHCASLKSVWTPLVPTMPPIPSVRT